MSRVSPLLAVLLLTSCARYTPRPLDDASVVLAVPVAAVLVADGATLNRPWLAPATIDLSKPLDPNAVATIAVIANPDLKAQRLRADVADAQAFAARLLPDPTFSAGADKVFAGPDTLLNITGALGLSLNALRTHAVDTAQARGAARQVRLDLAWAEWQTAGQARIQAARVPALEKALALARLSQASAQSLLDRNMRAAGRGDLAADQVQAARLAAFDAAEKLRAAERDLGTARFELAKLLGLPPATALRLAPESLPIMTLDADRLFAVAAAQRTDLQALRAGYAAQEASVHKAVLDQFPALNLTLNGNRDTSGNTIIGPAVDFTLPLWNRNRGGIAVERATRDALKAEYAARLFQTRSEIAAAVAGIHSAQAQRSRLLVDMPALSRTAEANRQAATRGDLSIAVAETAEQALRDKQILIAQSEQAISEQMIALELLTGTLRETWNR